MTGGDVLEITYNHPTLGTGILLPKAGEDSTFDSGGFESVDDDSLIDGGGNMIDIKNRKRWSCSVTIANDINLRTEMEKVKAIMASPVQADWTISHVSGAVYAGKGIPVGKVELNANSSTFPLKLAGGSILKKIKG